MNELATLPAPAAHVGHLAVSIFATSEGFEQAQRAAKLLAASDLLPKQFQQNVPNCVVAMEMANRLGASPFAVFQNLFVIHGRPGWSSQFLIAMVNASGRYSPLQFDLKKGDTKTTELLIEYWEGYQQNRKKMTRKVNHSYVDMSCVAYATEKASGERIESPPVTMEMAIAEGWLAKDGSKWLTMPEVMIRYRAASFFARFYCPDITLGMHTAEEINDMPPEMRNVTRPESVSGAMAGSVGAPRTFEPMEVPPEVEPEEEILPPAPEEKPAPKSIAQRKDDALAAIEEALLGFDDITIPQFESLLRKRKDDATSIGATQTLRSVGVDRLEAISLKVADIINDAREAQPA